MLNICGYALAKQLSAVLITQCLGQKPHFPCGLVAVKKCQSNANARCMSNSSDSNFLLDEDGRQSLRAMHCSRARLRRQSVKQKLFYCILATHKGVTSFD